MSPHTEGVPVGGRRPGLALFGAASLVVAILTPLPAAAGTATTFPRVWSPAYMGGAVTATEAEAIAVATRFNLIVAHKLTFQGHASAMKAANPNLTLLVYMNASFAQQAEETKYPEDWYARDANGNKIQSEGFGNWLMDVSNAGWIDDRARTCSDFIASSGYDGCWADLLGTGELNPGYLTFYPIDPATNQPWTAPEYLTAKMRLAQTIRSYVAPKPVLGNGLANGQRYFDPDAPSRALLLAPPEGGGLGGATAELFLRSANDPIDAYKTEAAWKQDVDMLGDAEALGRPVLAITKVWGTATTEQKQAWHKYALASFLLGTSGGSYFFFSIERSLSDATRDDPWWNIDLGAAGEQYSKVDGVYQRRFTKGRILVNPTPDTFTVSLGATYRDLDGNPVSSVTLGPHSGEVLLSTLPGAPVLSAGAGIGTAHLSWTAPADGGSPITAYNIYRGTASGAETFLTTVGNVTTYDDTTVADGVAYYYLVSAVNAVGEGPASNEVLAAEPGAPASPVLSVAAGDGIVRLSWAAPTDGGSPITAYNIYQGTASGAETLLTTVGNVTAYDDTAVTNGSTYYYLVSAVNAVGEGLPSAEAVATPAGVPSPPGALAATGGSGVVRLSWTAPADGGSPITAYNIYRGTASGAETLLTTVGNVTAYDDTAVTDGTTYYYVLSAVNMVGEGPTSNEGFATPVSPPTAPRNLVASTAKGKRTGVVLSWKVPESNGGGSIIGYRIYRSTSTGMEVLLVSIGNVTSYSDTATTRGVRYYYSVTAVNPAGEGPPSNEASALAK